MEILDKKMYYRRTKDVLLTRLSHLEYNACICEEVISVEYNTLAFSQWKLSCVAHNGYIKFSIIMLILYIVGVNSILYIKKLLDIFNSN